MKTALAVFLALAFTGLGVQAQSLSRIGTNEPPEFMLIRRVAAARQYALIDCAEIEISRSKVTSFRMNARLFAKSIEAIRTDGLPTKFRLAWFDYVQAWQSRAQEKDLLPLIELGQMPPNPVYWASLADFLPLSEQKNGTYDAWEKVERASLELGLDISHRY